MFYVSLIFFLLWRRISLKSSKTWSLLFSSRRNSIRNIKGLWRNSLNGLDFRCRILKPNTLKGEAARGSIELGQISGDLIVIGQFVTHYLSRTGGRIPLMFHRLYYMENWMTDIDKFIKMPELFLTAHLNDVFLNINMVVITIFLYIFFIAR